MKYVKVKNGLIVEGPNELSMDSSSTPNFYWDTDQLKRCNYFLVDISFDAEKETIDLNNPVITQDSVVFIKTEKSPEQLLSELKVRLIDSVKNQAQAMIFKKYSEADQLNALLGMYDTTYLSQMKSDISLIFIVYLNYKIYVSNATTISKANEVTYAFKK